MLKLCTINRNFIIMEEMEKDWKLNLTTPYKHYTVIADGEVGELSGGFECTKGNAFMGIKIWAESFEQCADVYQTIGKQIGFKVIGDLQIYISEPIQPPGENPFGYDITFTPFSDEN